MAYRDKLKAKEKLEKDILNLIQDFSDKTGYRVTNIISNTVQYQSSKGQVKNYINSISVIINP